MEIKDTHTFSNYKDVIIKHSEIDINVDFDRKIISGKVSHLINNKTKVKRLLLDINGLDIKNVTLGKQEKDTSYNLGKHISYLGRSLEIKIDLYTKFVHIYYSTSYNALALQWLEPRQTSGKIYPFLFTQSESILARSWIPCQDTPSVRFTYNAKVKVPKMLMPMMSAENPTEKNDKGIYNFSMKQSIPSYLLALAVGNIVYRPVDDRTGVYAEPSVIDKAVYEFANIGKMVRTAENLYGPYRWKKFDVLVLPPGFPFGGMENPCLTFVTPSIISGDRSLTNVIAHELAHSWSGNLVTNATWNDFWLNEGFTVYFERRIMEKIEDKSYADMLIYSGLQNLKHTIKELGQDNPDTMLKLNLENRDPDKGMTLIAYEKGFFFLLLIEQTVGRKNWDNFLKKYFNTFSFQSMDTENFIIFLKNELLNKNDKWYKNIAVDKWIYEKGLPDNCPKVKSERFEKVDKNIDKLKQSLSVFELDTKLWTTYEWLHFLYKLPKQLFVNQMNDLDMAFHFTESKNKEILCVWLQLAIENKYSKVYDTLEKFLINTGRRKFLVPLYKSLLKTKQGKLMAKNIYKKARPNYHYVSFSVLDKLLEP